MSASMPLEKDISDAFACLVLCLLRLVLQYKRLETIQSV